MIKFRKGSLVPKPAPNVIEATPKVAMASTPSAPAKWNPDQVVNLEWWQTPDKFKRRSVDELEIDLINVSYEKYFLDTGCCGTDKQKVGTDFVIL